MFNHKLLSGIMGCFLSLGLYAQHDNIWYFGNQAGLDFSSGAPVALTDSQMASLEGVASISDANGDLLFYTNGVNVWDKNHAVMPNGTGLFGNVSTSQSAIIVPKPESDTVYYIFTVDAQGLPNGVQYSEVDITLNGGNGDVTVKNVQLLTQSTEQITAVRHSNGTDVWVVTHEIGTSQFNVFHVTPDGVNTTPVTSVAPPALNNFILDTAGCLKPSPDGTRLAMSNYQTGSRVFDFDPATGQVSNGILFSDASWNYGVEFSPSGRYLYITTDIDMILTQFDLEADDIAASATQIEVDDTLVNALGSLQLGPDGKIYMSAPSKTFLSVIHNPDEPGVDCNFEFGAIDLGEKTAGYGLPFFLRSLFAMHLVAENFCLGDETHFSVEANELPDSIVWDFGDGETSGDMEPVHTYAAAGTYTVTATATKGAAEYVYTLIVEIEALPVANQPGDMLLCDDETGDGQEPFDLTVLDEEILGPQSPDEFTVSYYATFEDADAGINPLPQPYVNTLAAETLFARVAGNSGGCHAITQFTVRVMPLPEINMPNEHSLCAGGAVTLTGPDNFDGYLWSTGETTQSIVVDEEGEYSLTVTRDHGTVICQNTKTVTVNLVEVPAPGLEEEYIMCRYFGITVIAPEGYDSYLWSDGSTFRSVEITEKGDYTLTVTLNGCEVITEFTVKDILCGIDVPKGISPNNDGLNDELDLTGHDVTSLSIYNRYGQQVYSKVNYKSEWHGQTDGGHDLPAGTYFYSLQAHNRRDQSGWIYLNRELD